jgi:hypothetical protein
MDSFTSTIKNQHNFNKMIESQISQLAASVPMTKKGKILGKSEDLETTNLVDIYNAGHYFTVPSRAWEMLTFTTAITKLTTPVNVW